MKITNTGTSNVKFNLNGFVYELAEGQHVLVSDEFISEAEAIVDVLTDLQMEVSSDVSTGSVTDALNLGDGEGLYKEKVGTILNFKSIKEGLNTTLEAEEETVIINSLLPINGLAGYHGSFISTDNQYPTGPNQPEVMTFNNTLFNNGISILSGSRIKFIASGIYNLQFSAQFATSEASLHIVEIWLRKNGVNVPDSNTSVSMKGSGERIVAAWNFLIEVEANDYFELVWMSSDNNDPYLLFEPESLSPLKPSIPSIILTVQQQTYFQGTLSGSTRPLSPITGTQFFDTNLNKPIWYNGLNWVDSQGIIV